MVSRKNGLENRRSAAFWGFRIPPFFPAAVMAETFPAQLQAKLAVALAKTGVAADLPGLTQIKRLETDLGVSLFRRSMADDPAARAAVEKASRTREAVWGPPIWPSPRIVWR